MKQEFIQTFLDNVKRKGSLDLLNWLKGVDFFEAPASAKGHCNHKQGLAEHSLNTYKQLVALNNMQCFNYDSETLAIVALLHDVCKINCYKKETRYRNGIKESFYTHSEKFKFGGHGSKSVYLIQKHMQLTDEEAVAINNHMGAFDSPIGDQTIKNVFEEYPLACLLHMADTSATFFIENKKIKREEETWQNKRRKK